MGGALVEELLGARDVQEVIAPVRRSGSTGSPSRGDSRLRRPVVTFGRLSDAAAELAADQVFVCLGTTMKKAGSREAFRAVDLRAVVEAASVARDAGARDAFLVSSTGADPGARGFYLRVKGEAEEALTGLGFRSLHLFRPSILTGERAESRPAERMGIVVGRILAPLMVGPARRLRPIAARTVARAMARAAAAPGVGRTVHESERIAEEGRAREGRA